MKEQGKLSVTAGSKEAHQFLPEGTHRSKLKSFIKVGRRLVKLL